jgi:hypothetical protein
MKPASCDMWMQTSIVCEGVLQKTTYCALVTYTLQSLRGAVCDVHVGDLCIFTFWQSRMCKGKISNWDLKIWNWLFVELCVGGGGWEKSCLEWWERLGLLKVAGRGRDWAMRTGSKVVEAKGKWQGRMGVCYRGAHGSDRARDRRQM